MKYFRPIAKPIKFSLEFLKRFEQIFREDKENFEGGVRVKQNPFVYWGGLLLYDQVSEGIGWDIWTLRDNGVVYREDYDSLNSYTELNLTRVYSLLMKGVKKIPELKEVIPEKPYWIEQCNKCGGEGRLEDAGKKCDSCDGFGWIDNGSDLNNENALKDILISSSLTVPALLRKDKDNHTIKFSIALDTNTKEINVELILYDQRGNEIAKPINSYLKSGNYEAELSSEFFNRVHITELVVGGRICEQDFHLFNFH